MRYLELEYYGEEYTAIHNEGSPFCLVSKGGRKTPLCSVIGVIPYSANENELYNDMAKLIHESMQARRWLDRKEIDINPDDLLALLGCDAVG